MTAPDRAFAGSLFFHPVGLFLFLQPVFLLTDSSAYPQHVPPVVLVGSGEMHPGLGYGVDNPGDAPRLFPLAYVRGPGPGRRQGLVVPQGAPVNGVKVSREGLKVGDHGFIPYYPGG